MNELDYNWEFGRLRETGKYVLGERATFRMLKKGEVRTVIFANEPHLTEKYESLNISKFSVPLNSMQLGSVFGKPFVVSVIGVIDPGNSQFKGNE